MEVSSGPLFTCSTRYDSTINGECVGTEWGVGRRTVGVLLSSILRPASAAWWTWGCGAVTCCHVLSRAVGGSCSRRSERSKHRVVVMPPSCLSALCVVGR